MTEVDKPNTELCITFDADCADLIAENMAKIGVADEDILQETKTLPKRIKNLVDSVQDESIFPSVPYAAVCVAKRLLERLIAVPENIRMLSEDADQIFLAGLVAIETGPGAFHILPRSKTEFFDKEDK